MSETDPRHARNRARVLDALATHREPVAIATLEVELGMRADSIRWRLHELAEMGLVHQPRFGRWLAGGGRLRGHTRPPIPDEDREPRYDPAEIEARTAAIRATKRPPKRPVSMPRWHATTRNLLPAIKDDEPN